MRAAGTGGCNHGCPRHSRRAFGCPAQRGTAQGGDRRHRRHDDRVVRLLHLRHRRRADLPEDLLPQRRSADRNARGVRHLLHRLRRPADRRGDLRPLRRPHRPQGDPDRHADADGHRHIPRRLRPGLRIDRHLGRDHPDRAAHAAGDRRRRRMGRLGADLDGMGARPRQPRTDRRMAAVRRALRPVPVEPGDPGRQRLDRRRFRDLGLARAVLPQHRPDRHRPLDPSRHPRDAGVPAACSRPERSNARRSSR